MMAAHAGCPASGHPRAPLTPHASPVAQRVPPARDVASVRNPNLSHPKPTARATPEVLGVCVGGLRCPAVMTAVVTTVVTAAPMRRGHCPAAGRRGVRVLRRGEDGARAEGQRQGECGCAYELLHNLSNLSFKFLWRTFFCFSLPGRVRPLHLAPRPAHYSFLNRNGRASSHTTKPAPFPPPRRTRRHTTVAFLRRHPNRHRRQRQK